MADFPFDVVAFDLDGTLADTSPDIASALNRTLEHLGRPAVDPKRARYLIGGGAKALLRRALATSGEAPDELVEKAYPLYLDFYAGNICEGTACFPALDDAMDELLARGAKLAICTNKPERLTHLLVEALGWKDRFSVIVGGDTLPTRKPDPAMLHAAVERAGGGRAVLVGDSMIDAETARAAGIPFVAVSFGFSDRPVEQLGAEAVVGDYRRLCETLRRLGEIA
jgi:phosphoglycolate phosphatase